MVWYVTDGVDLMVFSSLSDARFFIYRNPRYYMLDEME